MARFSYGGQALIEGVLMRGRDAIAVALRHPDGRIVWQTNASGTGSAAAAGRSCPSSAASSSSTRRSWSARAGSSVRRASRPPRICRRADRGRPQAEGADLGQGSVALMLGLTLVAGIGIFFLLPLLVARFVASGQPGIVERAVEGFVQVAIFLGYLMLIAQAGDVRGLPVPRRRAHDDPRPRGRRPADDGEVRKYPTAHQRCGTEFLVVVIALSIIMFSLVGRQTPLVMILSRVLLIPVIAAVGYELLRFGARHRATRSSGPS